MNSLDFTSTDENGLSFDLIIDGQPMWALLEDGNAGIPYWLAREGLPTYPPVGYPPSGSETHPLVRIVTVCGCGESGCGNSRCSVTENEELVVFSHFTGNVRARGKGLRFVFPLSQYQAVCEQIARQANERLAKDAACRIK